jgi:hypothetical protein
MERETLSEQQFHENIREPIQGKLISTIKYLERINFRLLVLGYLHRHS